MPPVDEPLTASDIAVDAAAVLIACERRLAPDETLRTMCDTFVRDYADRVDYYLYLGRIEFPCQNILAVDAVRGELKKIDLRLATVALAKAKNALRKHGGAK